MGPPRAILSDVAKVVTLGSLLLLAPVTGAAQLVPSLGRDVTQGDITSVPDVAPLPADGFVVVRSALGVIGLDQFELIGQIYSAPQEKVGSEFQVNTFTTGTQYNARVASNGAGTFVAVWGSSDLPGGEDVRGRLFDATGTALTPEFAVSAYTTGVQDVPAVSMRADGSFVVAWSGESAVDVGGISARRFDGAGAPIGGDINVIPPPAGTTTRRSEIAVLDDDGFIVVYRDTSFVKGVRFDAGGTATTGVLTLGAAAFLGASRPEVVAMPDGGYSVGWPLGAQRYDAANSAVGPVLVPDDDIHDLGQTDVQLAAAENGDLIIAYGNGTDPFNPFSGTVLTNFARRYNAAGTPQSPSFLIFDDQSIDMTNVFSSTLNITRLTSGSFVAAAGTLNPGGLGQPSTEGTIHIHRLCDLTADPTCEICPGFDDSLDTDADGRPDGCDACNNAGGQNMLAKTRIGIRNPEATIGVQSKKKKFNWKGSFVMPVAFSSTDPQTQGARIRVEALGGSTMLDVELPGGAYAGQGTMGWTVNTAGTKSRYRDKTASPINGITQVKLTDRSSKQPGLVQIKVKGFGGNYPVSSVYVPISAAIVLGDAAAGTTGACGEVSFAPDDCSTSTKRLSCKN